MKREMIFLIIFVLIGNFIAFWLIGSAVTSGVKSISDDCGKTYRVEKVLAGNWFCPEEE